MARRTKAEDEQEVKIKLTRGDLEKVFNYFNREYKGVSLDRKYRPRHYFDTPDLLLNDNSVTLHMQYKEGSKKRLGGYEQTVKIDLPHGKQVVKGAKLRREIKNIRPNYLPDLKIVRDARAKLLLKPFVRRHLRHVFTAAMERRYFEVETGKGKHKGVVEIAFDAGEIILPHNGRHYPFHEIEVERKKGNAGAVDAIREEIMRVAKSAKLQTRTKGQQGAARYRQSLIHSKSSPWR